MRAIFKARKDPQPQLEQEPYNSDTRYSIELPAFAKIQNSLHVYFENMSRLFPALDRENTLSRIHKALESLQYPSSGPKIDIDYAAAPTIALLCIILAIAEVNENNALSSNINSQASNFRDHARSLLQTFELLPPSLEILRCHTLTTIYLLFMDFLDLAMQSSAVTVQMAMALQLHQQSPVPRKESDDHDRNLWWTIYILDRDIACLAGTPYLIRDEEIDAPRATRDDHFERFSRAPYINCQSEFDEQATTLERSRDRDSTYLEALAYLGRLWARIWNELISNQLEPECQWQIAAVLDSQINIFQQRLPSTLVWRNTSSPGLDVENEIQRQLLVLMVRRILEFMLYHRFTDLETGG
ncbi:uncharacterized protein N7511_001062 [Penicillium nucicola]|uniref:uncharacterized protein n=1 Tax=Penicillium nucicola TaxID=1850975 RepID=UPI002545AC81|nr:uncharacterized protein N7511_001062 [Penicillium nucicola]KAJ5776051.1 hypothetical protein N7511_001062 [Penicillium nucicola]